MALTDGSGDPEMFKQNLQTLFTWVCEIEELMANQKPPSSEFKVVKAQLQEQKVCRQPSSLLSTLFMDISTCSPVYFNGNSSLKFF